MFSRCVKTPIKLILHSLLVGERRSLSRFFRPQSLSTSKLCISGQRDPGDCTKSVGSPEPSLIIFVISTSPHGFIMLGSSD